MAENVVQKIKLKSNVSTRILGNGKLGEFNKKVAELREIANTISPDGGLYVMLVDRGDVFAPVNRAIRGLLDLEVVYSHRALQANPELAEEFGNIAKAMKEIDLIINKRKQSQINVRKKRGE